MRLTMKHDLLIIMPAYNEEASIGKFLDSLKEFGIMEYALSLIHI